MKIGYFPGCSLKGTAREFDMSLKAIASEIRLELTEIDDWSCCGASSAHVTSKLLGIALPARNLMLAEQQGFETVVAPCAACYSRMVSACHEIKNDPQMKQKVEKAIESDLRGNVRVINVIELLMEYGLENLKQHIQVKLTELKAVSYYGCLLVRPHEITHFDDPETPGSMDSIVKAIGATSVEWNHKTECCGGSHSIAHKNIVTDLAEKILSDAESAGANAVIVACPMCHSNLDMRQLAVGNRNPQNRIPIMYLTQILGLALGIKPSELGINLHFVKVPAGLMTTAVKGE